MSDNKTKISVYIIAVFCHTMACVSHSTVSDIIMLDV